MEIKRGFTLIEILIAIGLIAMLSVVASGSFFALFRGANKTEILKEVKQNGDYALSVLEIKMRNSVGVIETVTPCDGTARSSLQLRNTDATISTFSCNNGRITEVKGAVTNYLTNTSVIISGNCNLASFSLTCTQDAVSLSRKITVNFILSQANVTASVDSQASQTFSTQIQVRNK